MKIAVVSGIVVERDAISAAACSQVAVLADLYGHDAVAMFTTHLDRRTEVATHVVGDAWQLVTHPEFAACEIVIFHWGITNPLFDALWLLGSDRHAVVHFHNVTPLAIAGETQREVIEQSLRQLEMVVTLPVDVWTFSDHNRETLLELGLPAQRIRDVPFPIEPRRSHPAQRLASGSTRLICIGRLVPAKGVSTLIEAIGVLHRRGRDDIELVISSNSSFSTDDYVRALRQRTDDLGIDGSVRFVNADDDSLWDLLETADIVVSPSLHEGLCVPIIEGYLAGSRAIGTTCGNLPYVVQAPDPVVPPGDAEALATAIEQVARERDAGDEWRARVEALTDRFSRARTARRLADEIRHLSRRSSTMDPNSDLDVSSIRPWIDVQPDARMRRRTRASLNRLPDYADWEPGNRFTDLLRELGQPVTIHRKSWEYGLCLEGLEQLGALHPDATAIAVGAGSEPPLFHLANLLSRMVATDLYDNPDHEGNPAMLADPSRFAPFDYRRDHLEVYRMSGDHLEFAEDEFDVAFSLSSIEHFGSRATQRTAFDEMIRVVRPGGTICIMTELILTGHTHPEYFQWAEMSEIFLEHPAVELVGGEIDLTISRSLIDNPIDPRDSRTQNRSPHIVLDLDGMKWTSLSMFFRVR